MERIKVDLPDTVWHALVLMAEQEVRPLNMQAQWIITRAVAEWQQAQSPELRA